jgi:hypothetical protein
MVGLVSPAAKLGLEVQSVEVKCQAVSGMPRFAGVGLPYNAVHQRCGQANPALP